MIAQCRCGSPCSLWFNLVRIHPTIEFSEGIDPIEVAILQLGLPVNRSGERVSTLQRDIDADRGVQSFREQMLSMRRPEDVSASSSSANHALRIDRAPSYTPERSPSRGTGK